MTEKIKQKKEEKREKKEKKDVSGVGLQVLDEVPCKRVEIDLIKGEILS